MSYTNETTHFGIPLPLGSDLTTPMDYNTAAAAVDVALFEAQTNASQAATDASNAVHTANQAASDVGDLGGNVNTLTRRVTALEQSDVIQNNKVANLETKIPTKFDSVGVADAYVNGLTYAIGDVVTYNGQRYVCNTAITAAEPFDADKWTAKDIQAELDQINSDLISTAYDISVTADGTKTWLTLLRELYNKIDFSRIRSSSTFSDGIKTYQISSRPNTIYVTFVSKGVGGSALLFYYVLLHQNTNDLMKYYSSTNNFVENDITSNSPDSGTILSITY